MISTPAEALSRYLTEGPHAEYRAFEAQVRGRFGSELTGGVWQFIDDAVDGTGGFSTGGYIQPFRLEIEGASVSRKYRDRMSQADYDPFASEICNAAWNLIVASSDMIARSAESTRLQDFWRDADGNGGSMLEVLEFPFREARKFGSGWLFVDRPMVDLQSVVDDLDPAFLPYAYGIPTRNVVDWDYDTDGALLYVTIVEPDPRDVKATRHPIRVWMRQEWALFTPRTDGNEYDQTDGGRNALGIVPGVQIHNDQPEAGRGLGRSEMLAVAKCAQTVYNLDSEAREIERKCALFLAMPVRNAREFDAGAAVIGTDNILLYDGEAGAPAWVSPDLSILDKIAHRRQAKIESAYASASLRALVGSIQTTSGFHAEVEFAKTERRIARFAATLEAVELEIARLFLRYVGESDDSVEIMYPREFGVRDVDRLLARLNVVLDLNLGESVNREVLASTLARVYPRKGQTEIEALTEAAILHRTNATAQGTLNGAQITALGDALAQLSAGLISNEGAIGLLLKGGFDEAAAIKMVRARPTAVPDVPPAAAPKPPTPPRSIFARKRIADGNAG